MEGFHSQLVPGFLNQQYIQNLKCLKDLKSTILQSPQFSEQAFILAPLLFASWFISEAGCPLTHQPKNSPPKSNGRFFEEATKK